MTIFPLLWKQVADQQSPPITTLLFILHGPEDPLT